MKELNNLHQKLSELPIFHQLAFGIVETERFLPNYFAFHFAEQAGNPNALLSGIDFLKHVVYTRNYEQEALELLDELIEEATPDMDEYPGSMIATTALDVSSMFYECFAFVQSNDTKHIHNCSQIALNSIEMYIQQTAGLSYTLSAQEIETQILSHGLIKEELEFQARLVDELFTHETIKQSFYLRQAAYPLTLAWRELYNAAG